MGVPVVSLIGDRHQCRVGRSLLAAAGHADWSATTEEDYIAAVVRLAGDPAGLAKIRSGLREDLQRGPLLDHAGQAERFGRAVRETWVDWCARRERETLLST